MRERVRDECEDLRTALPVMSSRATPPRGRACNAGDVSERLGTSSCGRLTVGRHAARVALDTGQQTKRFNTPQFWEGCTGWQQIYATSTDEGMDMSDMILAGGNRALIGSAIYM